jgi:ERCC4-type nuclease
MLMIIIDAREQALIGELTKTGQPFAVCNMHLGDISIKEGDEVKVLLERKTYSDLAASLKDKRYREQLNRFRSSNVPMKGYIIEGCFPVGAIGGIPVSTIDSMLLGLIFRDSLIVLHSRNTAHTAELILKLHGKLTEYREDAESEKDVKDSLVGLSNVKKDNMTPEICYLSQLAQLPQISTVSAKAIASIFPNMPSLITFIQTNNNALVEISNIKVTDRRLGKSIAAGMIKYLMNDPILITPSPNLSSPSSPSAPSMPSLPKVKVVIKPKITS